MNAIGVPKYFADREDAGRQLAAALARYRGRNALVLAIPRGGIPIGRILADALGGELDVVLVRKLGAPFNPEFAIGAIDEAGTVHLIEHVAIPGADRAYIRREAEQQLAVIRARRARYSPQRPPIDPAGRVVIVVDDGLATGATMKAALHAVRVRKPLRLICAVPVAAPDSLSEIQEIADEVVCLSAPQGFRAVGYFYREFPDVDDEEALALLTSARSAP